jgi:hypothetical protein
MGSQQILLIILGVIIVGIALSVGVSMMSGQSTLSRRDAMITELQMLGEDARTYFIRPASLGGGGRNYANYRIPPKLARTLNGVYTCTTTDRRVFFRGADVENPSNTILVTLRRFGATADDLLTDWSYTGEFQ